MLNGRIVISIRICLESDNHLSIRLRFPNNYKKYKFRDATYSILSTTHLHRSPIATGVKKFVSQLYNLDNIR